MGFQRLGQSLRAVLGMIAQLHIIVKILQNNDKFQHVLCIINMRSDQMVEDHEQLAPDTSDVPCPVKDESACSRALMPSWDTRTSSGTDCQAACSGRLSLNVSEQQSSGWISTCAHACCQIVKLDY